MNRSNDPKSFYGQQAAPAVSRLSLREMAEQALKKPTLWLAFPPPLEARFEADSSSWRLFNMRIVGTACAIVYGLFVFTDLQLPPAFQDRAIAMRVLGSLGLLLTFQLAGRSDVPVAVREALFGACLLGGSSCNLAMFCFETDDIDKILQICGIIAMVLGGIITVPCIFRYLLISATVTMIVVETVLWASPLSGHARSCLGFMMVCMVVMGLITVHRLELQQRRDYLKNLLDSMRYSNLLSDADNLRTRAERDALTGLLNRGAVDARLQIEIERCRMAGIPLGLILIDIDWFKSLNDRFGHVAGDECLRMVARILDQHFRSEDIVGRYGGEEFVVALRGQSLGTCARSAERVRLAIERAGIIAASPTGCLTASFGVASLVPGADCVPETVLKLADDQLYAAKRAGRNRVSPAPLEAA
jgi:diguanylate cyclase (GGDEF)-like protein